MADQPNLTKKLTLKALDGEEVTLTLKIVLSEWDWEQLDKVYFKALSVPEEGKKIDVSKLSGLVVIEYRDKALEIVVEGWTRTEPLSPENIKKAFTQGEYAKLDKEVRKITKGSQLSKAKKKS